MRLFRISAVLLVTVLLLMAAPGLGEVQGDSASGSSPNMCDPTTGGPCIIADFIASPTTGDAPLRVQFLDTSSGRPSMWSWDFGDGGNSSAIADPVHVYTKPGKYTVTLVVSSQTGGSSTKVKEAYIIVRDPTPIYADFVASPTWGMAPLTVVFSDCTIGDPTTWLWDFGDGQTDTVENPTHVYQKPGKYTVTLTASNELGGSSTKVKEKYITVEGVCEIVADFNFSPETGSAPLTVSFTDTSLGNPTMWSWDFGDGPIPMDDVSCSGGGCNNIANPTHTYTEPGTYTVRLTASSETCTAGSIEKIITVNAPEMHVDFSGTPTSGKAPLTVKFTDLTKGGPTMWSWEFGDGKTDMVANPTHVYTEPGTYTVRLSASNQMGGSGEMVKERYITVDPCCDINADFVATPTSGNAPLTVKFTDTSTGNPTMWKWDFGDGPVPMDVSCSGDGCNNIANPVHTYLEPGNYTVTLTASDQYGCSDTETKKEYIVTVPACDINADFIATPTTGNAPLTVKFTDTSTGNPTMWSWDFGDGPASMDVSCSGDGCNNIANPVHTYLEPGNYTVTLTASNQYGCSDTETKKEYIVTVPACDINADFIATPTTGNAPLTVKFTDTSTGGPTMWSWDFGDGPIPMDVSCSGDGCNNIANPVHTYLEPGNYTVTLTASNQYGCSDTETKKEFIVAVPACDINADFIGTPTTGPGPLTVSFTDKSTGGATMWKWDFGDGANPMVSCSGGGCDNIANPVHTYLDPGTYTVTLTASNQNGCSDTEVKKDYIVVVPACDINADFIASPTSGNAPLTVNFTDKSTGSPTMWKWDFGDGAVPMVSCSGGGCDNIANPFHTYLDPGTYTVTLTASNQNGCSDTEIKKDYITVGTAPTENIPVSAGWNFVSTPKKLEPGKDTAAILSNIDSQGHSIFQYDETKHVWNMMNSASPIRPLDAFWIYSSKADKIPLTFDKNPVQTPPTKNLKKGWNGIGFTGLTPIEAKYTLLSVQNQWVNCVRYNGDQQRYNEMIIKGSNDNTLMEPYMGYWLYVNAEGILAANAA